MQRRSLPVLLPTYARAVSYPLASLRNRRRANRNTLPSRTNALEGVRHAMADLEQLRPAPGDNRFTAR